MSRFAALLALLLSPLGAGVGSLAECPVPAAGSPDAAAVERALQQGAACLERDLDGTGFRDPYLSYVYPEERLPAPPGVSRLTYRLVDAYTILAMLGRAGTLPAALSGVGRHAETILSESAPLWRGGGFNNTVRDAHTDGVALDTFCMVGWLFGDEAMAGEAATAIEGDRWLPPGWYDEPERFRAPADECWCLRLIAATTGLASVPRAEAVLDRIEREFMGRTREEHVDTGSFYEAWHIGMVIAEEAARSADSHSGIHPGYAEGDDGRAGQATGTIPPAAGGAFERGGLPPGRRALFAEVIRVLDRWAAARADGDSSSADVLEWSNLASADALALAGAEGARLKQRALRMVLSSQGEDGCWSIHDARRPRSASSFVTLRALVALQPHREVAAAGAALETRRGSPDPAP